MIRQELETDRNIDDFIYTSVSIICLKIQRENNNTVEQQYSGFTSVEAKRVAQDRKSTPRDIPQKGVPFRISSSYKLSKMAFYLLEFKEHLKICVYFYRFFRQYGIKFYSQIYIKDK